MMRTLDRSRPYGSIFPATKEASFQQDGLVFDQDGNCVGDPPEEEEELTQVAAYGHSVPHPKPTELPPPTELAPAPPKRKRQPRAPRVPRVHNVPALAEADIPKLHWTALRAMAQREGIGDALYLSRTQLEDRLLALRQERARAEPAEEGHGDTA